jgi:hypothetical protein
MLSKNSKNKAFSLLVPWLVLSLWVAGCTDSSSSGENLCDRAFEHLASCFSGSPLQKNTTCDAHGKTIAENLMSMSCSQLKQLSDQSESSSHQGFITTPFVTLNKGVLVVGNLFSNTPVRKKNAAPNTTNTNCKTCQPALERAAACIPGAMIIAPASCDAANDKRAKYLLKQDCGAITASLQALFSVNHDKDNEESGDRRTLATWQQTQADIAAYWGTLVPPGVDASTLPAKDQAAILLNGLASALVIIGVNHAEDVVQFAKDIEKGIREGIQPEDGMGNPLSKEEESGKADEPASDLSPDQPADEEGIAELETEDSQNSEDDQSEDEIDLDDQSEDDQSEDEIDLDDQSEDDQSEEEDDADE